MKKIIGLTAISLALGAATFGSVASAQWGGWGGDWDDEGTTVVVRCGDNDRCGDWNRCGWGGGWNRCGNWNRCGWNRCGFDRCGWGGGWNGGWGGGWNGGWGGMWY